MREVFEMWDLEGNNQFFSGQVQTRNQDCDPALTCIGLTQNKLFLDLTQNTEKQQIYSSMWNLFSYASAPTHSYWRFSMRNAYSKKKNKKLLKNKVK